VPEDAAGGGASALAGLRVVEMTEALAGPFCAMTLGDLGADVIKIERPGTGDQSRRWGPPFLQGESAYFLCVNRNKRSLEVDIKEPEELALLHRLLASADVFITNNPRMESLERARLDPATVESLNPRSIYVAISGYGHTGPKAGRAGYDVIAQGAAGLMALTGEAGDGPMRFPTAMADLSAGVFATIGALAALYARDRPGGSGAGQVIDVALLDSQVAWLANIAGTFFATGERPAKLGNLHPTITPYQPLQARDKMMIVAVGTPRLWRRFCEVLGVEDTLRDDPRFETNEQRNTHRPELVRLLEAQLARRDAEFWIEALTARGVPAGPINFPDEALSDEQLAAREMIVELEHPLLGVVKSLGSPIAMSATAPTYRRYPPRLGEHNEEIRGELGG
jgi:crotonobetainyl-CoA:carnitine CoA-transferase CaiB-like acyl-CoA transferase